MTEQQAQTHPSKQNVDAGEIAKFNALAEQWWDPNSQFRPLHDINPLRLNYIDERVSLPGKKVIDIGCGGGLLSEGMARRGADVTGIDMGDAPLAVARIQAGPAGVAVESPPTPADQIAETRANSILLRWQYPTSATYFEIQRDGKVIATINGDLLSYQDNNLQPNQTFGYQVIALNASGQRSESVSVSATTIANEAPEIRDYPPSITLTSEAKKDQLV